MLLHCGVGEDSSQSLECFCTVVLEKILDSPLDSKEIQPINPKGNQSWTFTGRTDAEAETPILRPPNVKTWLIGKDPDTGKDWRQEQITDDKMVGWHHRLDGHEFEQALGVGDGQGSLACCSPWDYKESDTTKQLNWTEQIINVPSIVQMRHIRETQSEGGMGNKQGTLYTIRMKIFQ